MERRDYLKLLGIGSLGAAGGVTIQINQPASDTEGADSLNQSLTTTHTPTTTTETSTPTTTTSESTTAQTALTADTENTTTTTTTTAAPTTTTTTTTTQEPTTTTTTATTTTSTTTSTTTTTTTTPDPRDKYVITRDKDIVKNTDGDYVDYRFLFQSQNRSQWFVEVVLELQLNIFEGGMHRDRKTNELGPGEEWDDAWNKTEWMNQQEKPVSRWWIEVISVEIV